MSFYFQESKTYTLMKAPLRMKVFQWPGQLLLLLMSMKFLYIHFTAWKAIWCMIWKLIGRKRTGSKQQIWKATLCTRFKFRQWAEANTYHIWALQRQEQVNFILFLLFSFCSECRNFKSIYKNFILIFKVLLFLSSQSFLKSEIYCLTFF